MTTIQKEIKWSHLSYESWHIHLAATVNGLCYVGTPGRPQAEMESWLSRKFPKAVLVQDASALACASSELHEFLAGHRQTFTTAIDIGGTPFQEQVWAALRDLAYGSTCSYSDIAAAIGRPAAVRAVGTAIGANPVLITVPCHRVVGKNGALTGYRGGVAFKEYLLRLEQAAVSQVR